jgi:type I restriction enzyme S subunit
MTRFKPVDLSDEEAAANSIKPGAFYVVRGNGNLALVGRGGMAPDQVWDGVVFPDLLIEVNLKSELISGRFLRLVWDFDEIRSDIERRARTSAGIHKINLRNLSEVRIPVPTLEVQRSVANELADRFERASEISSAACAEARELQALPGALFRRAFRGEM